MPVEKSNLIEEPSKLSYEIQAKDIEELRRLNAEATGHLYKLLSSKLLSSKLLSSKLLAGTNIVQEQAAIATIQEADPTDFKAISGSKLTISNSFYNNTLRQSQQSFLWSLIWAGVGAIFIMVTVTLVIVLQPAIATSVIIALLGGTGGVGSSAIAYATLQLYKQASDQAAACHIRLDRASDFILANSACEGLIGPEKERMRSEIIRKLVE